MQKSDKVKIAICDNDKIMCNDIANLIRRQKPDAEIFIFVTGYREYMQVPF